MLSCDKCAERAVYSRRYSGQRFCEEHFLSYFEAKVRRTLSGGKMIERGDVVAVGLSGGKDSLTTLYLLSKMRERLALGLHAIAVDEGIKAYRKETLTAAEAFCSARKIPLSTISVEERYGFALDKAVKVGKNKACTYCGVLRRKLLNEKALELGANKLAMGHNLDDEVQAIMMNYISGDVVRVARYASEVMVRGLVRRIKPLGDMPEKEVALYAHLRDLEASFEECPYTGDSRRSEVRSWLNAMEEESPGIKYSILRGYQKLLPHLGTVESRDIRWCKKCGDISSNAKCKACSLVAEVKKYLLDQEIG